MTHTRSLQPYKNQYWTCLAGTVAPPALPSNWLFEDTQCGGQYNCATHCKYDAYHGQYTGYICAPGLLCQPTVRFPEAERNAWTHMKAINLCIDVHRVSNAKQIEEKHTNLCLCVWRRGLDFVISVTSLADYLSYNTVCKRQIQCT